MKKKRLYIVRNLEEINQADYENDQPEADNKGGKGKGKDTTSLNASPKKKGDKDHVSNNSASPKEIDIDKWKPFYFDLFNRVGNLTVLSLRKEVN